MAITSATDRFTPARGSKKHDRPNRVHTLAHGFTTSYRPSTGVYWVLMYVLRTLLRRFFVRVVAAGMLSTQTHTSDSKLPYDPLPSSIGSYTSLELRMGRATDGRAPRPSKHDFARNIYFCARPGRGNLMSKLNLRLKVIN
jgi:hypothetical protein